MGRFKNFLVEMTSKEAEVILGLSKSYTTDDVKTAYKLKAKENHPDLGGSVEDMQNVNSAYELLKNSKGSSGNKVDWDEIAKKYSTLRDQINGIIKQNFNDNLFNTYFEKEIGQPFFTFSLEYVDEKVSNPHYGGIKVKFKSKDELIIFELTCLVYLVNVVNSNGLTTDSLSIPMDIYGDGYINARKFKLFNKSWGNKLDSIDLNQPEVFFPKNKLASQASKNLRTKATKKDFEKLLKTILNGKEFTGGDYGVEVDTKNRYLHFSRMTFRGKGAWTLKFIEKDATGRYPRVGNDFWSFNETNELLDLFISFKGKSENEIRSLLTTFKDSQE